MKHAELAAVLRALADEVERGEVEERPRARARKVARLPVAPPGDFPELARARVRSILRRKGYRDAV